MNAHCNAILFVLWVAQGAHNLKMVGTWGPSPRIACPTAASLALTASNGLGAAAVWKRRGKVLKPSSPSRTSSNSERPRAVDCSSSSSSNRSMRAPRSLQFSPHSSRQYVSTRGRSSVHVPRTAWREGSGNSACLRHTIFPARPQKTTPPLQPTANYMDATAYLNHHEPPPLNTGKPPL
jgi:hypothetical protein